nr:ribonuclease P protein component [Nitratireductor alexandrii]
MAAASSRRGATAAAAGFRPEPDRAALTGNRRSARPPERMRKRADFLTARRGEKRRGRLFLLEVYDRGDDAAPRLGLTVTKKTGNAVIRNLIRRRLKEAVRTHAADDMARGKDYVIVGRREIAAIPFDQLKSELSRRMRGTALDGKQP